uniref:Germ cell-less protein-like 1 n=1 Tax=Phallusia mammillata TaxID=59560 RepID=A0A6F9DEC4_9ASCI|nr:germ cell-less protein-like 1 [Phallusia mammillata]
MGNILRTPASSSGIVNVPTESPRKRKRRDSDESGDTEDSNSHSCCKSRRKKTKTTSQYIYNALFENGENSDIKICAFKHEWNLHKIYLKQAKYFSGMFQSQWKESLMGVIDLQIPDENVTKESLNTALGSLYSDEVDISPETVVSVLSAASLIQLEGLMQQCSDAMKEYVCCENVCNYYANARMYGQGQVERKCIKWMENNLMMQTKNISFLTQIEPELMAKIVSSSNLFVLQVEMDVYTLLKKWAFLRMRSNSMNDFDDKNLATVASEYFQEKFKTNGNVFLETPEGAMFIKAFQAVRLCNVIIEFGCCLELEKDCIVPPSWLMPLYRERWLTMLRVEQGVDHGPQSGSSLDSMSLRCGRILQQDTDHCWRWNGYNFALDLLVTYNASANSKYLLLKRNIQSQRRRASVGLTPVRRILYHIRVFSVNKKGHVVNKVSCGPSFLALEKDDERIVLHFNSGEKLHFPLLVTATFKIVSARDMGNSSFRIPPISLTAQSLSFHDDESDLTTS